MTTKEKIFEILNSVKPALTKASETSNLFLDLGFDSLAFVKLLVDIEESFFVTFELKEMQQCLVVGSLIECVEAKLRKNKNV